MKWTFFTFILFLLISCAQNISRFPAGANPERHVVFDIDWTIVSEIKTPTPELLNNSRIIQVQGTYYFINEGLEEFVSEILSHPEIKLSFFSGGKSTRNIELLSKIKLKNGKSLREVTFKILGAEDLVSVEAKADARFAERFKKDLTKVSKNLDQLIMFDDTANFTLVKGEDQGKHVFFIGKSFEYFDKYKDAEGLSGEFIPKNYDEWFLNRKKLNVLSAVFKEAYAEAVETGISLSESLKKREEILNLEDQEWNSRVSDYYRKSQNNEIPIRYPSRINCQQIVKNLMWP